MNGACHVVDLPYVFGQYKMLEGSICPKDPPGNAALCAAVTRAWTNFAYSGDPNTAPPHKPPLAQDNTDAGTSTDTDGGPLPTLHTLPPWPALSASDPDRAMILDVPLSAAHTQSVRLHEHFPTLWRIAKENARALWFHRPPGGGSVGEVAAKERALQSNL
jgi:hypothetical protein